MEASLGHPLAPTSYYHLGLQGVGASLGIGVVYHVGKECGSCGTGVALCGTDPLSVTLSLDTPKGFPHPSTPCNTLTQLPTHALAHSWVWGALVRSLEPLAKALPILGLAGHTIMPPLHTSIS
jgi:hypothetical protein